MITSSPVAYEEFMAYLEKLFTVTENDIKVIIRDFHSEMQKGLSGYESSLKMIPSFVDRPNGTEKGRFIALDLGGTNFRVLAVELDGKGGSSVLAVSKFVIRKECMEGNAKQLFDFIAECIEEFLVDNEIDRKKIYDLAFTFSFPVDQSNVAAGKLICWTKGFTTEGVVGEDVVVLLNEALRRRSIECIRVAALANDTVGTLVAKSYQDTHCDIGVILGTGSNACYPEQMSNISKWRGISQKGKMIINMEWGNFNKLRRNCYDKDLDEAAPNTGDQFLEKMVSGMYLGEISRRVIYDLVHRELMFSGPNARKVFDNKESIETKDMSLIQGDTTTNLGEIEDFLTELGVVKITLHDKKILHKVCQLVSTRAARVSAAAIAAVVTWMDPELKTNHTVGIDGSLFEKYPGFSALMDDVFVSLFREKAKRVKTAMAKDGSGKGAAIIAAVAASSEK
jgi:hexokinase